MRRIGWLILVLLLVGGVLYSMRATVALRLMENLASGRLTADPMADLEDGLHVVLCGAGSPLPDPRRSGPCVGVVAGGRLFVIDAGSSASRNLGARGLSVGAIEAVLLTHFHSDHIDGLGELGMQSWVNGTRRAPTPLVGPPGVEEIAEGLQGAYRQDSVYRTAHHGAETVPPGGDGFEGRAFRMPTPGDPTVVLDDGSVKITAFVVDHSPVEPAVGYRFDYAGRSVVITGDTVQTPEIERMSKGVDLLVHEALAADMVMIMRDVTAAAGRKNLTKILGDILDYHTTPVQAAETAEAAGAKHLLLYHIVPPLIAPGAEAAFLDGVSEAYHGPTTLGEDGTHVAMPAGSDEIDVRAR